MSSAHWMRMYQKFCHISSGLQIRRYYQSSTTHYSNPQVLFVFVFVFVRFCTSAKPMADGWLWDGAWTNWVSQKRTRKVTMAILWVATTRHCHIESLSGEYCGEFCRYTFRWNGWMRAKQLKRLLAKGNVRKMIDLSSSNVKITKALQMHKDHHIFD